MTKFSVIFGSETRKCATDKASPTVADALYLADVSQAVSVVLNDEPATMGTPIEDGDVLDATPVSGKVG